MCGLSHMFTFKGIQAESNQANAQPGNKPWMARIHKDHGISLMQKSDMIQGYVAKSNWVRIRHDCVEVWVSNLVI